jgi:hypothetical protein
MRSGNSNASKQGELYTLFNRDAICITALLWYPPQTRAPECR